MTSLQLRLFPLAAALAVCLSTPLAAQNGVADANAAARELSMHLNTLSTDTHNLRALIGAGEAALVLEDPNAAIGFFGRAEEIDPRNGRIKAGLAKALLILEQPRDALRLFDQASDLGVADAEIARDRGLAYDLRGDQARAQRDYALALKSRPDEETTRRMALSLGIDEKPEQAMVLLDPLLRKQDKAAWRARAFILAMNGDVQGANGIARVVMPASLATPMQGFFPRLKGLSDADKAMAVHFGRLPMDPKDRRAYAQANTTPPTGAAAGLVPATNPAQPKVQEIPARRTTTTTTTASTNDPRPNKRVESRLNTRVGEPRQPQPGFGDAVKPVIVAGATALPPPGPADAASRFAMQTSRASDPAMAGRSLAAIIGSLELETPVIVQPPVPRLTAGIKPAAKAAAPGTSTDDKKAETKKAEAKKAEAKKAEAKKPDPKKAEPARQWVQIATGANKAALTTDFGKMVKKSPEVFRGTQPWTVPFKATRRLLVGPFDTSKKAQDFVSKMGKAGISGFAWTSPAGQEIEKLPAK